MVNQHLIYRLPSSTVNYDGYSTDDFKRAVVKDIEVKIAEFEKHSQYLRKRMDRNLRKVNDAASTQQVIICLLTITFFKYVV